MKISANKLVSADYELYVQEDGALELIEKTEAGRPFQFVFGAGMMLPKFEEQLFGLQAGDKFDFVIEAADAYGEYLDENVIELERATFEVDGKLDEKVIFEGNVVPLSDGEGNSYQADIVKITDTHVTVDLNHPLADEDLHFKGTVLDVHEPTSEELTALMGGGCSCGCGCEDEHDCADKHCGC
ncbi:MAG: FKBP-type peptidyl-prolyl cis-trans isomerase [Prevotellaceae bacterium]|jgi:FKBP-type peptidyl-prolyl cis-trans isomerase SlyD|nr:FKBP-type peptidyl-prolyl cis-trans isomerase [Prevotellaceae bacterium]